jgi:hypothetical protein
MIDYPKAGAYSIYDENQNKFAPMAWDNNKNNYTDTPRNKCG